MVRVSVPAIIQQSFAATSVIQQTVFTSTLLRLVCKTVGAGAAGKASCCALGGRQEGIAHSDWGEALGSDRQKCLTLWLLLFWNEVLGVCAPSFKVSGSYTVVWNVAEAFIHNAVKSCDDIIYFWGLFSRISVSASLLLTGFLIIFLLFAREDVVQHTESSFFLYESFLGGKLMNWLRSTGSTNQNMM